MPGPDPLARDEAVNLLFPAATAIRTLSVLAVAALQFSKIEKNLRFLFSCCA